MADWKIYLAVGVAAALSIPLADVIGARDILYFGVVILSLCGIACGIVSHKPELRSPWLFLLAAISCQFVGALIQANTDADGVFGSSVSIADSALLLGHVWMAIALWQFASRLHREFPRHGYFQGWILAISLILIGWQLLFLPTIVEHGFSVAQPQTFRMVYPTLSYVEVGMLLWIWISSDAYRSRSFFFLSVAIVLFASAESLFHGTTNSLGVPGNLNLVLWLLAYVAYGAAALHPDMTKLGVPKRTEEGSHANNVLTLLLPLVLLLPVGLLVTHFKALHPATLGILGGFFLVIIMGWYQLRVSMKRIIRANRLLEEQNRTDYLTGKPNRNQIERVMRTSVQRSDKRNGLLLIDIDGFKSINNMFGFHMGDLIIKAVADRLHADCVERGHHFARVDGDEFAVLMLNMDHRRLIEAQAWQVHRLLEDPIVVNDVHTRVMCSIGVSVGHAFEQVSFATMMKESERALGWARERQSQVEIYDKRKDLVEDKSWILTEFRVAVTTNQLMVYYQPKVHSSTNKVIGVEALVRWDHPQRGLLMPFVFLHKIESTDLAHQLFTLVLNDAGKQWQNWSAQALVISIAINVVARDIMHFDLVGEIRGMLAKSGMPAHYLEIEITESSALSDPVHVKKVLSALMALGVKISIDDYGTGYSSLLYLQQWPLHFLKIDQQFIRQMRSHQSSAAIVRSTMELAKSLNVEVIAEGVEDAWVYRRLRAMRCYGVQGFLFSQAVPADSVLRVVREVESTLMQNDEAEIESEA